MMLQNQNIHNREQLQRCFTIEEQYGVNILKKTPAFLSFVLNDLYLPDRKRKSVDSAVLSNLEPCTSYHPDWFSGSRIDSALFMETLNSKSGDVYPEFTGKNKKKIGELLSRESFNGEEARLLCLFMLLHIQAMRDITDEGMAYMNRELDNKKTPQLVSVDSASSGDSMPMSGEWLGGLIPKTITYNGLTEYVIPLGDTTQRRTLFYEESLTCFESNGQCLFFLPRTRDPEDRKRSKACDPDAYRLAMQDAYRGMPGAHQDKISKPILDPHLRCAGYLLKDGSVLLNEQEIAAGALDADADDSFIYLATEHGIDTVRRSDLSRTPWLGCDSAVEEVNVLGGNNPIVDYRCIDSSEHMSKAARTDPA